MIARLYLVWFDRPDGLAVVPFIGIDRVSVIARAVEAAKTRLPVGSKVHLIRSMGQVRFPGVKRSKIGPMLRLVEDMAFQGLPDRQPTPAQRRFSDSIASLHQVVDELQAQLRKETPHDPA